MQGESNQMHSSAESQEQPQAIDAIKSLEAVDESAGERTYTKDDVERIVKERLARAQKQAEKREHEAREQAAAKALEEQGEWRKLAEQRQASVAEIQQQLTMIQDAHTQITKDHDVAMAALTKHLDAQKAALPEHIKQLLEKLSVVDQLEWIAGNQAVIETKPTTQRGTPSPSRATSQPQSPTTERTAWTKPLVKF